MEKKTDGDIKKDQKQDSIQSVFATNLYHLRIKNEKYKDTKKRFADDLGIAPATYNTYENFCGGSIPKFPILLKICELLNVSIEDLFQSNNEEGTGYSFRQKKAIEKAIDKFRPDLDKKDWRLVNGNLQVEHLTTGQITIEESVLREVLEFAEKEYITALGTRLREILNNREIMFEDIQEIEWQKKMAAGLNLDYDRCQRIYIKLTSIGLQSCFSSKSNKLSAKAIIRYANLMRYLGFESMTDFLYAAYFLELEPFNLVQDHLTKTKTQFSVEPSFSMIKKLYKAIHDAVYRQSLQKYHIVIPENNAISQEIEKHYLQSMDISGRGMVNYLQDASRKGYRSSWLRHLYIRYEGDKADIKGIWSSFYDYQDVMSKESDNCFGKFNTDIDTQYEEEQDNHIEVSDVNSRNHSRNKTF